jgi:hypothetical protein
MAQTFRTTPHETGRRAAIHLPFDADEIWGTRERHYVSGTVDGRDIRGVLEHEGDRHTLVLGEAWRRDNPLEPGREVEVVLRPESPLPEDLAPDVAAALQADAQALSFFRELPPFYRKNYIRWIETARREATRAGRITETVALLRARRRER